MITEDVLAFLRSRPIAMMCTRDGDNRPSSHETLLAGLEADHLDCIILEHLGRNLAQNVAHNGDAALLVSRAPGDHRSVQVKGKITALEPARLRPELFAGLSAFLVMLYSTYMPEAAAKQFVARLIVQPVFRLRLDVAQVFDQTPGPFAGRPIGAGA